MQDSFLGQWEIQPKSIVEDLNSEVPFIWNDTKRISYYGIYSAFGYMGVITSDDGIIWENSYYYKVLDKALKKVDGTMYCLVGLNDL